MLSTGLFLCQTETPNELIETLYHVLAQNDRVSKDDKNVKEFFDCVVEFAIINLEKYK